MLSPGSEIRFSEPDGAPSVFPIAFAIVETSTREPFLFVYVEICLIYLLRSAIIKG